MHGVFRIGIAATFIFGCFARASAEDYPTRPITYVVTTPAGGIADTLVRAVSKTLSQKLGQPVIVENKPGGGGIVAAEYVLGRKADGYTIMFTTGAALGHLAYRYKKLSFDPFSAFTPVHGMVSAPMVLAVPADAPYKTFAEFVAHAKKYPDAINYNTLGLADGFQLFSLSLQKTANFNMTAIAYKGNAPALADLLGGSLQAMWDFPLSLKSHLDAGKLRALGVASEQRLPFLPNVPTFVEQGYPEAVYAYWSAAAVSAATPQPVVDKLARAYRETLAAPNLAAYLEDQGNSIMGDYSGARLRKFVDDENHKMKELLDLAGVQPQ